MAEAVKIPKTSFVLQNAAPFWLSFGVVPLAMISAVYGGLTLLLLPLCTWWLFTILDALVGRYEENADPGTAEQRIFWHRAITIIWFPVQLGLIIGLLFWVAQTDHLSSIEELFLFLGLGVISGTIGINYSHELMHQRPRIERWLADLLLACVLYSHFRSEHLLVHHRYVGTPRDPVTARYNEGFHRFFPRVLLQCLRSAFRAEQEKLARKGLPWWHSSNPFWRYWALQAAFLFVAFAIAGSWGLLLFVFQALIAIWQLELVNYVEHYGLTRKHLGEGKYEHTQPRHSWNSAHRASNWLLINLQRHSDHHYRPDRRFPLLQSYSEEEAPNLPFGYPVMTVLAMIPPLWRRCMNPRVRRWRSRYYPEITDWQTYQEATNPMPR